MREVISFYKDISTLELQKNYPRLTFGGTTRYKCRFYKYMEDEFHPVWHSLSVSKDSCEIKVNVRSYNIDCNDQLESTDFIWFTIKKSGDSLIAVCQLNSNIKFLLHGKPTKNMLSRIANNTLNLAMLN